MLDKINTEITRLLCSQAMRDTAIKISDDFRKAGALAGIGLVSIFIQDNKFSIIGGSILTVVGVLFWGSGVFLAYFGTKANNQMEDEK